MSLTCKNELKSLVDKLTAHDLAILGRFLQNVNNAAWCEGRDAAAALTDELAERKADHGNIEGAATMDVCGKQIRALTSPYEPEPEK